MLVQIPRIEVDYVGQHRRAALLRMECQHFRHCSGFAEGEEQEFGVVAIVEPTAWFCRGDDLVDALEDFGRGTAVKGDAVDLGFNVTRQIKGIWHQGDNCFEARLQMMAQGCRNLDIVFDKDQRNRALGQEPLL